MIICILLVLCAVIESADVLKRSDSFRKNIIKIINIWTFPVFFVLWQIFSDFVNMTFVICGLTIVVIEKIAYFIYWKKTHSSRDSIGV